MKENKLISLFKLNSENGNHNTIFRFLISCLGSTPIIGGVFGAIAASWGEKEQSKINIAINSALKLLDDKVMETNKTIYLLKENRWIASFIKINTYSMEIIDSSNVSSITCEGDLKFEINFITPIRKKFISQYYGNREVKLDCLIESDQKIKVTMIQPIPDIITFIFLNLD